MSCFIFFLNFLLIFWRMRKEGNARKKSSSIEMQEDGSLKTDDEYICLKDKFEGVYELFNLSHRFAFLVSVFFFLHKTLQPTAFKERRFVSFNILAGFEQALRFCLLSKRATSFFSLLTNAVDFSRYCRPFVKYPQLVTEKQY